MRWLRGLLGVVAVAIVIGSSAAGAQTPPSTPGEPPSGAPSDAGPPADLPAAVQGALDEALIVVAEKAAVLDLLDAFQEPIPPPLQAIITTVEWGTDQSRDELIVELAALDAEGRQHLDELSAEVELSGELRDVLAPTTAATQAKIAAGETGVLDAGPYLSAIDDLVMRAGRAPQSRERGQVDGLALVDAVDAAYIQLEPTDDADTADDEAAAGEVSTTSTVAAAPTASGSSESRTWIVLGLGALVAVVLVVALVALRRGRSSGSGVQFDELLEVSRTLALARTRDDVERITAEEAARLLSGTDQAPAAVVRRSSTGLEVGYATISDVLVPERLGDGLLARVLETGQAIVSVVTHEPALRSLPSALAAVPIIGGGRVEGVILVVRSPDQPFSEDELGLLRKMGPIAAASLDSARHADASTAASLTDPLTQVGNRRKLEVDLRDALEAATGPTALVMVDLDHFKVVNDTFGHPAGDELLCHVARLLRQVVRPEDGVYRYGGEEFALLLPATPEDEVALVADRARESIERDDVAVREVVVPAPTASLGVAATTGAGDLDGLGLISSADRALYRAKQDGRNRVVTATTVDR